MLKISMRIVLVISVLKYANGWCNCIRAKDCLPLREKLLNTRMDELDRDIERVRNSGCGFNSFSEPLVCCPTRSMETMDFINDDSDHSKSTKNRWVWERRPQTSKKKLISKNLIDDYFDWNTQRNCPPILFKETSKKLHTNVRHSQHSHGHRRHHHYSHRHPPKVYDFDDDFRTNNFHHHGIPHLDQFDDGDYDSGEFIPGDPSLQRRPDLMTTTTTRTRTTTRTTTTQRTPTSSPVNMENCGITLNNRIIGGIEALPGEFPWITRIAYLNRTDNSIAYRCTGSFITDVHILTAAHCVANLDTNLNISHIRLADSSTMSRNGSLNTFQIYETIVHPNYDSPRRANDIAILKINKPPNINLNYGIICLPSASSNDINKSLPMATVAGWSNDEGSDSNNTRVRYLKLAIMNNSDCADRYNTFREGFVEKITIISSMVCTQGQSNGSDVCRGDSGGPLMDDSSTNREGRYTLIGIVAFGPICGFTNLLPGVYMRISEYVDWIVSNIS